MEVPHVVAASRFNGVFQGCVKNARLCWVVRTVCAWKNWLALTAGSTHACVSLKASNIQSFSKFLTAELDVHENRQLQITMTSLSYLCQLLWINGFGTTKAFCINPTCLALSWLLQSIDSASSACMIWVWWLLTTGANLSADVRWKGGGGM